MRKHVDFLSQSSQFLDGFIAVFHFGVGVVAFEELADFVELDLETGGGFVEIAQLLDALELAQKLFGSLLEYLFGALTEVRIAFLHLLVDVEAGRAARVLMQLVLDIVHVAFQEIIELLVHFTILNFIIAPCFSTASHTLSSLIQK